MIKLLHAADFHLDSAFTSLPPIKATQRRAEQRLTLRQLAAACENCDIVLLSGDLFEGERIYLDTIEALKEFFASISAQIFISPGNHDPITSTSPYLCEDWGENVHIFTKPEIERVRIDALNCDVYGAAFVSQEQPAILGDFHVLDEGRINLMVLHGEIQKDSPYAPILKEQIAGSGLDYLALGHVHRTMIERVGQTNYAYPGCLMGRGFDECGQKGALRVTVKKGVCDVEFMPLRTRRYEILRVDVGDDALASICAALPQEHGEDCYRIVLTGESDGLDPESLYERLVGGFYSLQLVDQTLPKQELWSAATEDTLRGHFLRILKQRYDTATQEQRQHIAQAAKLVLSIMDGREVHL